MRSVYIIRDPRHKEMSGWALVGTADRHITAYWSEFLLTQGNNFQKFLIWMQQEHGFELIEQVTFVDLPQD